jgi:hypothetical protein
MYLTDQIAEHVENLLAGIAERSGFGRVVLSMAHRRVNGAEDQATHKY